MIVATPNLIYTDGNEWALYRSMAWTGWYVVVCVYSRQEVR